MRDRTLHQSVRRLLGADERIEQLVHMWSRGTLTLPYIAGAFCALLGVAFAVGIEQWGGRIGLALGGGAIAAMASTEYRVLALTSDGLVLLRSSRVRQKATSLIERLPAKTEIVPVGGNLVMTDWRVGAGVYTVMKRHQAAIVAISQR